jgi:predicted DNA-binding transcriptional regulator AlpA
MGRASDTDKFISAAEAAQMLGCTRRTIARMVRRNLFPGAHKATQEPNSPLLIPRSEVELLAKKRAQDSGKS